MRELRYGDMVTIVANPEGLNTAPFKRFKKKEENTYEVSWRARWNDSVEVRFVKAGRRTNAYYTFDKNILLPVSLANKKLEDYL